MDKSSSDTIRRVVQMDVSDELFGYFASKGIFHIDSAIEEGMPSSLSMALLKYHQEFGKSMPIAVVLNSPGGETNQGFAIYDTLRMIALDGRQVNILCMGQVASMATFILQAGTRRFSLPHTQFLIHEVSQFTFGDEKVSDGEERVGENRRINTVVMNVIANRIGMNPDELVKLSKKKDYWLDAGDALKLGKNGLIDEITERNVFDLVTA
jgi:ATP-dependent Clp endopeptidase proteolytic subunit ClpP